MYQKQLEKNMDEYLVKKAPFQIPESGRKALADWAPILALIGAALTFLAAIGLWRLAHSVNDLASDVNELARAYGVDTGYNAVEYGVLFYVAFVVLLVQGALLAYAYPGLKDRSKKRGWDILLLGVVIGFVYNLVYVFTESGSVASFIFSLIGVVISLYILAQIKGQYKGSSAPAATEKK